MLSDNDDYEYVYQCEYDVDYNDIKRSINNKNDDGWLSKHVCIILDKNKFDLSIRHAQKLLLDLEKNCRHCVIKTGKYVSNLMILNAFFLSIS